MGYYGILAFVRLRLIRFIDFLHELTNKIKVIILFQINEK